MMPRWRWLLTLLVRRLWLRVTVLALLGIVAAVAGIVGAPFVPEGWTVAVGAASIEGILNVLASSMLAVTVFSLSTMVAAYGAATTNVTPRASRLLMEDPTSQNVLGTFIGSFLFSLVGIVALGTGLYGPRGRAILLIATTGLIVVIAVTILRWIDYVTQFGRVAHTITRVEETTWAAMKARLEHPYLGGRPLTGATPPSAVPVFGQMVGYVQHVDVPALEECGRTTGCDIFVLALPGTLTDPSRPVAAWTVPSDAGPVSAEDVTSAIGAAFTVGTERTFDQDPRFGLCVLAEIASRALSPAVNDPGTAIDVIGRSVRLLVQWSRFDESKRGTPMMYPQVWVPGISVDDMFDDVYAPIARDGAGLSEVHVRLQKAFVALHEADRVQFGAAARRHSSLALARADTALTLEAEKDIVRSVAARLALPPAAGRSGGTV